MTPKQRLQVEQSEKRQRVNELLAETELTDEQRGELDTLTRRLQDIEPELRAAIVASTDEQREREREFEAGTNGDGTPAEVRALLGRVGISEYLGAALDGRALASEAGELNAALEVRAGGFPLRLLAPEVRATTTADAETNTETWIDRLFATSAASYLGVSMREVPAGVTALPVTTAGAGGTGNQQDKSEAASDAPWTVSVIEAKPKRAAVRASFSIEDTTRLPGLEEALRRDLGMALMESVDRSIFLGDAGPTTAAQDITGFVTATGVADRTISQTDKVKGPETLAVFTSLIDGKHASDQDDLRVVASVGAQTLWYGNFVADSASTQTVAGFLRENRVMWRVRGEIDTNTAAGDWAAFVAGQRNVGGAAIAAVWNSGMLVRDQYTAAAKGEVAITLNHLWDFVLPRASHFARLKFVA